MTDTAVHSPQIFGSYSRIMRLVIYCYIETLKRHRKNYLPLTCNWVCHSKNTTKGDFIVPARRRLSPKHGGDLGALPPLGSPRIHSWRENEAAAPGYSTQELCMKKQISSQGNFCLLECLPCNPILWATSFGNAAQSGDWQRLKGSDSFQRTVEKQDTSSNTLTAAFCLATCVLS